MQNKSTNFRVLVCGCSGGAFDENLSCYLLDTKKSAQFLALDAGSLLEGISLVLKKNLLEDLHLNLEATLLSEVEFLRNYVKGYAITHAHLDHIKGLVINSPVDSTKKIFGSETTIKHMREHVFNNVIWPNFANEGHLPLNLYQYVSLPLEKEIFIPEVGMSIEAFSLEHPHDYSSTAFLLKSDDRYVLYFGDTSPDVLEKKKCIYTVWKRVAPLIKQNLLKDIFIECTYADNCPDEYLFGHLKPKYLIGELQTLASLVDVHDPLRCLNDLRVYITHIKKQETSPRIQIIKELNDQNHLNVKFIFPSQGDILYLS